MPTEEARTLNDVLDRVESCAEETYEVSVGNVVEAVGRRSFAPLVLLPGLVMLAPGPGDIPGVPVLMGMLVIMVVVQMLLKRRHLWLPGWLRRRSLKDTTVRKLVSWLRRPSRFVDRWSRPRLTWAVSHGGFVVMAVACIVVAMATPLMEVVPFSANLAGAVITAFGLALVSRDGLLGLMAIGLSVVTAGILVYQLV